MLKRIALVLVVVALALGVAIVTRPDDYRVERSVVIDAPAEVAFGYVNDFHRWSAWSPFEKLDPNLERNFGGAPSGVGAVYGWSGNSKAGRGTMTIAESAPSERITIDLHFEKPFESSNPTVFTFTPQGEAVTVTWTMSGENTLVGKAFSLVADMDGMIGRDFEEGLANLKRVAEEEAARRSTTPSPQPRGAARSGLPRPR